MIRNLKVLSLLILFSISAFAQKKYTRNDYIDRYKEVAIKEMKRSGVPASITLAQGILESDNGNSALAVKANNHFGIKCHDWSGRTYYHDDDRPNECFRKYKNASESFRDHSDFLTTQQRYSFLFEYKTTDYKSWAHGLKRAGYATHPKYDKLLIDIIEESELYKYDSRKYKPERGPTKDNEEPRRQLADNVDDFTINPFGNVVHNYNRIDYINVEDGQTIQSIAKDQGLRPWQLYKYNELSEGSKLAPGQRIYLQPKRRKAEVGNKYHTIESGENMYIISQLYGIKLKHLYRLNNLEPGSEPEVGYTLNLRKRKRS